MFGVSAFRKRIEGKTLIGLGKCYLGTKNWSIAELSEWKGLEFRILAIENRYKMLFATTIAQEGGIFQNSMTLANKMSVKKIAC